MNNKKGWYTDDSKWTYKQEKADVSSKPYSVTQKNKKRDKKKQSIKKQSHISLSSSYTYLHVWGNESVYGKAGCVR